MKLCLIGKYPPIQGGVSRQNFWSARSLAERGFEVHVVTNAPEMEPDHRILLDVDRWLPDPEAPPYSGEGVAVHASAAFSRQAYTPWANPFVTKLAARATRVVREHGCDLIFGYYFEPYGMAAHLASQWTGVPYGIRHAGSDIGRLFQSTQLKPAYTEILKRADFLFTGGAGLRGMVNLGVDPERIYPSGHTGTPPHLFRPEGPALDIPRFLEAIRTELPPDYMDGVFHRFAGKPFDPAFPTIGIYGKPGAPKGTFDLVRAVARLRREGLAFNFVALSQGRPEIMREFVAAIEEAGIEDRTWLLPFIPHWRVPAFIRACTAVCFLERDFPIAIHTPGVAKEIVACGGCLVVSTEIHEKQGERSRYRNGENALIVDPKDTDALAGALRRVILDPEEAKRIGRRGFEEIDRGRDDYNPSGDRFAALLRRILAEVTDRRTLMSAAEMQSALARLCTDGAFRRLFELEPESTLNNYKLSEEELSALRSIDAKMLRLFSDGLKAKRRGKLEPIYPLTFKVVPHPEMQRFYSRFYELHPATPGDSVLFYPERFGQFLSETLETDPDVPPYAADLCRHEWLQHAAQNMPDAEDRLERINERPSEETPPIGPETQPRLAAGVRLGRFRWDVVTLADQLREEGQEGEEGSEGKAGEAAAEPQPGEHFTAYLRQDRSLRPKVYRINAPLYFLLDRCDGRRTAQELTRECERHFEVSGLEETVRQMLAQLAGMSLVRIASEAGTGAGAGKG